MTKWRVYGMGLRHYVAERVVNDKPEFREMSAHCLACAKSDVLARYGGSVDLRGWHKQGICGAFLKSMQIAVESEGK